MIPTTGLALFVIVLAVLPGFVYQVTLRGWRGPRTDEADVNVRVLRAISGSALFAVAYVLAFGSPLIDAVTGVDVLQSRPRSLAFASLMLVLFFPWLTATVRYYVTVSERWRKFTVWTEENANLQRPHTRAPTAWDEAFDGDRTTKWVRVQTPGGAYIGGWYGNRSMASAYPQPRDLFLQRGYRMNADGSFGEEVTAPNGIWIRCDDARTVEFIAD